MSKVFDIIEKEKKRQNDTIELIASENFVSEDVMRAVGSCLTNKYAEGYPKERHDNGKAGRYYGGCQFVDELEEYCCDKWKEVFKTDYHVNVQPHSGSSANLAAYMSVLEPEDTILALSLDSGGHLTHGSDVNFSGKFFTFASYDTNERGFIDPFDIKEMVELYRPKMVVIGASAYSRKIDFKFVYEQIKAAVENVNTDITLRHYRGLLAEDLYKMPYIMVDMAHIAGLVAADIHPSPFGYADIITTTTHKTLRGPRGGLIFCKPELAKKIDNAVFPCCQGGPLEHIIAGKAVAAEEALTDKFKSYIRQVVSNCHFMSEEFIALGYDVVTGGTDNHLFLIDFSKTHPWLTGKMVQEELDRYGISLNKNCVPGERRSPSETSGVRIGTAAMTTKGYKEDDFIAVARTIDKIINGMQVQLKS